VTQSVSEYWPRERGTIVRTEPEEPLDQLGALSAPDVGDGEDEADGKDGNGSGAGVDFKNL
jgi:hypothetical protein